MEALRQACLLYKRRFQHRELTQAMLTERQSLELDQEIQGLLEIGMKEVSSKMLFATENYYKIFERALMMQIQNNTATDLTALAKAYNSLEKYFLQLVEHPWKREFKRIKLYGGFYRTRIKSVLPEPEFIFQQAGYTLLTHKQLLVLESPANIDNLLVMAFDSRLCTQYCLVIMEHYQVVKGLSMSLAQAAVDIFYKDRSRGRQLASQTADLPSYKEIEQQMLMGLAERKKLYGGGYDVLASGIAGVPNGVPTMTDEAVLPQYANYVVPPSPTSSTSIRGGGGDGYTFGTRSVENSREPLAYLQLQQDRFEGMADEHILRSIEAVRQLPYPNQNPNIHVPTTNDGFFNNHMLQEVRLRNPECLNGEYEDSALKDRAAMPQANMFIYPPGLGDKQRLSHNGIDFNDEGIERDLNPSSKSPRFASYVTSPGVTGQSVGVASTKLSSASLQSSIIDHGYNTNPVSNNGSSGSSPPILPLMVDQGLAVSADGVNLAPMGPPPIPPRSLKPNVGGRGQSVSSPAGLAYSASSTAMPAIHRSGGMVRAQISNNMSGRRPTDPSASFSSSSLAPKLPHSQRRDHLALGKSSSLNYSTESQYSVAKAPNSTFSLLQKAQMNRAARSMDLSHMQWQCLSCTALNLPSDRICSICASSRQGSITVANRDGECSLRSRSLLPVEAEVPPRGSTWDCKACTFTNSVDNLHCEMCNNPKQGEPFTYV